MATAGALRAGGSWFVGEGCLGGEMVEIELRPWSAPDLDLLKRANAPEMMEHLGGPESEEKLLDRHRRYLDLGEPGSGQMFSVILDGLPTGTIGYWERDWQGETVYETGWSVLPEFQGRGIATAAALVVCERAAGEHRHGSVHAYPGIDHPASNAICRKAGFTFGGEYDFEYPPGNPSRCNDWYHPL